MSAFIYRAKIRLLHAGFLVAGILMSGTLSCIFWKISQNEDAISEAISWIFFAGSLFCCLYCIITLLLSKTVELTDKELIICKPAVFSRRKINLSEIKKLTEKDYKIRSSHNGNQFTTYTGKQISIILNSRKIVKFNSLEICNYFVLVALLRKQFQQIKTGRISYKEPVILEAETKQLGYGWLIFTLIVSVIFAGSYLSELL